MIANPQIQQKENRSIYPLYLKIFETGIENGELSGKYSASYCADFISALTLGLQANFCMSDGDFDMREYAKEYMSMAYNILASD